MYIVFWVIVLVFLGWSMMGVLADRGLRRERLRQIQEISCEIQETTDKKRLAYCYSNRAANYEDLSYSYSHGSPEALAASRSGLQDCEMAIRLNPDEPPTGTYNDLREREAYCLETQGKISRENKRDLVVIAIFAVLYWYMEIKK